MAGTLPLICIKMTYIANWLIDHPSSINKAWVLTDPKTSQLVARGNQAKREPGLNEENLRHFKMAHTLFALDLSKCIARVAKRQKINSCLLGFNEFN
jgi:hypothetical protein